MRWLCHIRLFCRNNYSAVYLPSRKDTTEKYKTWFWNSIYFQLHTWNNCSSGSWCVLANTYSLWKSCSVCSREMAALLCEKATESCPASDEHQSNAPCLRGVAGVSARLIQAILRPCWPGQPELQPHSLCCVCESCVRAWRIMKRCKSRAWWWQI